MQQYQIASLAFPEPEAKSAANVILLLVWSYLCAIFLAWWSASYAAV